MKVKTLKKYEELWSNIRDLIRSKTNNRDDYDEKFMKVKFNLDDDLPLQKTLQLHNMIIFVKAIFNEDNKYYPTFFMNECLYKLQMIYFDRIDISEDFDANKTNASYECDICLY